jgi:hypothetical protein
MTRRTNRIVLYSHLIEWEPLQVRGGHGYAWIKTLGKDDETGARTALIRYDPGFRADAGVSTWPADIYTLEGAMTAGERTYREHTYHYRPAGTPIGPAEAPEGVTRLVFTADSKDPERSSSEEVFVQNVVSDLTPQPPGFVFEPAAGAGAGDPSARVYSKGLLPPDPSTTELDSQATMRWMKILRLDPKAEISFRVQRVLRPGIRGAAGEIHVHPYLEECFMVSGDNLDYSGDIDGHWRWIPGVYVCRAPGEGFHGDSLKLDDNYYLIVRCGWTADPAKTAEWTAAQDTAARAVPTHVEFDE